MIKYNLRVDTPQDLKEVESLISGVDYSGIRHAPHMEAINSYRKDIGFTQHEKNIFLANLVNGQKFGLPTYCFLSFEKYGLLILGLTIHNPNLEEMKARRRQKLMNDYGVGTKGINRTLFEYHKSKYSKYLNNLLTDEYSNDAFYSKLESRYFFDCHNAFIPNNRVDSIKLADEHFITIKAGKITLQFNVAKRQIQGANLSYNPYYRLGKIIKERRVLAKGRIMPIKVYGNLLDLKDDPQYIMKANIINYKENQGFKPDTNDILYTDHIYANSNNSVLKKFLSSNIGFLLSFEFSGIFFIKLDYRNGVIYLTNQNGYISFSASTQFYLTDPAKNGLVFRHAHERGLIVKDIGNFSIGFQINDKSYFDFQNENFDATINKFGQHPQVNKISNGDLKRIFPA